MSALGWGSEEYREHATPWHLFRGTWETRKTMAKVLASWGTCHPMAEVLGDMSSPGHATSWMGSLGTCCPMIMVLASCRT